MAHEFEVRHEVTLEARPEQVWQAIAEGPGIDSWFMGRTELEPREGGTVTQTFPGDVPVRSTITAWEPGKRLAYGSEKNPDGTSMAFEYLIEGRDSGTTVVRLVHSGFLGDDWEAEYDALKLGDLQYLYKLAAYLKYFPGRISTHNLFLVRPEVAAGAFRAALAQALGVRGELRKGLPVVVSVPGFPAEQGVVEWVTDPGIFVGVRTDQGLYMFVHAQETAVVEHHGYRDLDGRALERGWESWLARSFAG
ncbi:SRPBCC domain-containing protein [Nonomuraea sp. NN258]|uniref:SRPBCC family protein n=1 Tax=Nonomuraea antri TaxID=2730852 RepID=UPI00156A21C6|nr:SRPBCC domain-containing protein [Nonomuraea antri]NRQ37277.1 SRPBCC domain-containing protein [Nonomuraea antri]